MATRPSNDTTRTLPYTDTPAGAADVAKAVTHLVNHVAGAVTIYGAHEYARRKDDHTEEPGRSVFIAETQLALALESWLGEAQVHAIEAFEHSVKDALGLDDAGNYE